MYPFGLCWTVALIRLFGVLYTVRLGFIPFSFYDKHHHHCFTTGTRDVLSVETSIAQKMGMWIDDCRCLGHSWIVSNGSLHNLVTWYYGTDGINYAGTQITQWDCQNKGKSGWTGKFYCFVPNPHIRKHSQI